MSRPIKVLFMQSQTYFGADSRIHALLMRYFDRQQVEVHVACNPGTAKDKSAALKAIEKIPDIHLRITNFGPTVNSVSKLEALKNSVTGLPAIASLAGLAWYIKKHKIDIIHCTEKPRDAFYGLLLARMTGAKCLVHLHVKAENWISPLVQWAMKQSDSLVGVSEFVGESIVKMGYPLQKVDYVLNSLDISGWDANLDGSPIREEFGIAPDMPLLTVISRLFHWKGHTELLKALAKVKESTSNFKLLIVGEDDPRASIGGGSYTEELKALTSKLNLNENVIFTGFRSDVARLLAACDIYSMPSFEEPFGVVYLEAMAMKKPVITLDNGGSREVIEHGKSGLLSLPQDIETLAANILTLIRDPELRTQMGEYGRKRVEEYFNPQRMATDTVHIYQKILNR